MRVLIGPDGISDTAELSDEDLARCYVPPSTPWFRVNMVSTLDGSAVGESGVSGSINNSADHRVFALLRSLADVVIVGAGTARAEGYRPAEKPIVVVSRSAEVPESLRGAAPGQVLLATVSQAEHLDQARDLLGAEHVLVLGSRRVDLGGLAQALADAGHQHQLCEGGPHLLRDLLAEGVVDELDTTVVPRVLAGDFTRITQGPPVDVPVELAVLLEHEGTLLARWLV